MPDPAGLMLPLRVVMRPVHDAALVVPFVLAIERNDIAFLQRVDARRDVDVVGNQERPTGIQLEHESLVTIAHAVVAENANDPAFAGNLDTASALGIGVRERIVACGRLPLLRLFEWLPRLLDGPPLGVDGDEDDREE